MTSESVLHGWSWEITVISVIGKINLPWKSKGYPFAIQILHSDHAGLVYLKTVTISYLQILRNTI